MTSPSPLISPDNTIALLATELQTCRAGGLYLALYTDPRTPRQVADALARQSPDTVSFPLQMDAGKAVFSVFFKYTFDHLGSGTNIFHVLGIEDLEESLADDFIRALQGGREMFRNAPYALVFWVTPEFEKRLSHLAPDFYHWLFHVFDFTHPNVAKPDKPHPVISTEPHPVISTEGRDLQAEQGHPAVGFLPSVEMTDLSNRKNQVAQPTTTTEFLPLENIRRYLKKALEQFHHWKTIKERGQDFLIEPMGRANLSGNYVPSSAREIVPGQDRSISSQTLDEIFAAFLADSQRSFMALLGDFGTGKTSFSLHYFVRLAEQFLEDPNQRIPLFISLKDYPGRLDSAAFLEREFFRRFEIPLSFAVFRDLALAGRFVLFVDGFDEMASLSDQAATLTNFRELTKLTFENLQFMVLPSDTPQRRNKLFLTCRTHYFLTEAQQRDLLTFDYTVLYRNYATRSRYAIATVLLQEFTEAQVLEYVENASGDPEKARGILDIIKSTYNLEELSSRPLLLEMIVASLERLKDEESIDAYQLYKVYTDIWIERDDWRARMTPEGKRASMWELAAKMHREGGDFSLHYSQLDPPKPSYLKPDVSHNEEDYFRYEVTTCSFLNRDGQGNYKFIHKSFWEFFLAEYAFYTEAPKPEPPLFRTYNKEVVFFLLRIVMRNKDRLAGRNLSGIDMSSMEPSQRDLSQANLRNADLSKANLREADLREADLRGADLREANLRKANLREANLRGADLWRADLWGANQGGADLRGANLL
uniref:Pentapeptide repeat-containing protein n=1 Tax=Candidatus Kentrum sp. FW TaxID=2126338 RepID=A0A450TMN9_9GAMM|nr:MAG: Pentapeptide repeat-containing protein [Candidatus Kentron sp. FW]